MNHVGNFFSKILGLARNKFNAGSTPKRESQVYKSTIRNEKLVHSRKNSVSSDQSSYSDYKTPALFASARRKAKRFVKSSIPKIISSFKTPKDQASKEKLNTTFCVKKIDWDQISLEDDDYDDGRQEFRLEKRNNGTWHLNEVSLDAAWIKDFFSPIGKNYSPVSPSSNHTSGYHTFFTPMELFPTRTTPENAAARRSRPEGNIFRTSSVLDICRTDQFEDSNTSDPLLGQTFEVPSTPIIKKKLPVSPSLRNALSATELSFGSSDCDDGNNLRGDSSTSSIR